MNKFMDENSLNMSGYSIDEMFIGQKCSTSRTITESMINDFAGITGDFNPLHSNAEYAKESRFGERAAHGMLTASFISTVMGMGLPGADCIYLGQTLKFIAPVKIGDTITATAEVTKIRKEKKIAYLKTTITNQRGEIVIDGEATVMATK